MFNVGGGEVLVILVLALVVLGPDKLPETARSIGKHIGDFRRISNGFRSEISNAMDLSSFTGPPPSAPTPQPASVPAATPDQDHVVEREHVPSATVRADGPVDSFV